MPNFLSTTVIGWRKCYRKYPICQLALNSWCRVDSIKLSTFCSILLVIPSIPSLLCGAVLRIALSISDSVIGEQMCGSGYLASSISLRSAYTSGGKKEAHNRFTFRSGIVSREPSGLISDGVMDAIDFECRLTAYFAIFHRPSPFDTVDVIFLR